MSEVFPIVDETGRITGSATREECHGNPSLLHPVVHCVIVNSRGDWLLQRRSVRKDIQPGKWDTSVGGHVSYGEEPLQALVREVAEEVGITVQPKECLFLHTYINSNQLESELVHSWLLRHDGPFTPQESEVDELRFWSAGDIRGSLHADIFTPNFIEEFGRVVAMELPGMESGRYCG